MYFSIIILHKKKYTVHLSLIKLKYILSAEYLYHLAAEQVVYLQAALGRELIGVGVEKIIL